MSRKNPYGFIADDLLQNVFIQNESPDLLHVYSMRGGARSGGWIEQ